MTEIELTTIDANAIVVYADRCLKMLNLRHWAVILAADAARPGALAAITPSDGRYVAMVYVCEEWASLSEPQRRSTILHECVHLLHAQIDDHLRNVLENNTKISADLWHAVYTPFMTNSEYMVDHLTSVFRFNGLMPKWPSEKKVKEYMKKHGITDADPTPRNSL